MPSALNVDTLQLFLAFVVPGIIVVYFRSLFLTGRMPPISEGLVSYLTISLVYHAATFGLFLRSNLGDIYSRLDNWRWGAFVFVIPAALGIFSGLNARHGWTAFLFEKIRASTVHPIACAWDWRFSNCPESWVRVKLNDGTEWAGILGTHSFLSSNPAERDLYLQRVFFVDSENNWTEKTSSVWIGHGHVQSIEMWPKA